MVAILSDPDPEKQAVREFGSVDSAQGMAFKIRRCGIDAKTIGKQVIVDLQKVYERTPVISTLRLAGFYIF